MSDRAGDFCQLDPMIGATERELQGAGVDERPEVVLANAKCGTPYGSHTPGNNSLTRVSRDTPAPAMREKRKRRYGLIRCQFTVGRGSVRISEGTHIREGVGSKDGVPRGSGSCAPVARQCAPVSSQLERIPAEQRNDARSASRQGFRATSQRGREGLNPRLLVLETVTLIGSRLGGKRNLCMRAPVTHTEGAQA